MSAKRPIGLPAELRETIRHLHPDLKRDVRAALDLLSVSPESGKALKADLEGWRSLRVRRFRIVYRVSATSIDVAAIGPRTAIYLDTAQLVRRPTR